MARQHSAHWLSDQARVGLRELPANAAWLASQVHPGEVANSAAERTRDKVRKVKESLADAAPLGESVETRMKSARAAAERAQEAEDEALEAVQCAKASADRVRQLAESNRAWLANVERDADGRAAQRVAEAQRAADERLAEAQRAAEEQVQAERAAAKKHADAEREKARAEANEEMEAAQREAEAAQQRADELLAESRDRLAEARQLAGDAEQAARAEAEEAHRQAQQLTEAAERRPQSADAELAAAAHVREDATVRASKPQSDQNDQSDGNLESRTKAELQDLAIALEIDGHTKMTKAELVSAITKAKAAIATR